MHTTNLKKYLNITEDAENMVIIFNYFQNETYNYQRESWDAIELYKFLKVAATRSYT